MRVHNFCAGPCTLPLTVLEEVKSELLDFRGAGMSVIEMSHRSPEYEGVHEEALSLFRSIFEVPEDRSILFLQGGATLQFALVPMNLLAEGERAGYVRSGTWGKGALKDAQAVGDAYVAWDGEPFSFTRMPGSGGARGRGRNALPARHLERDDRGDPDDDVPGRRGAARRRHVVGLPEPADPWERFDLVYGGVQKNLGPAGLAVVVVRSDVLERGNGDLPRYLSFAAHAAGDSLMNTPPVFSIYVTGKVLRWIRELGGVSAMEERAARRSGAVYDAIETSGGFYRSPVEPADRSHMNVVFRTPSDDADAAFPKAAGAGGGLVNLKGHRSVGGIRASIYNAMPDEGVDALVGFMAAFRDSNG